MKKFIAIIVFMLAMFSVNCVYAAANLHYDANGSNGIKVTGSTTVETDSDAGVFYVDTTSASKTIYFNIDDAITYGNTKFRNVTVTVKYLDNGAVNKFFAFEYDAVGSSRKRHEQYGETYIDGDVKTVVYELEDAYFRNRLNGGDFAIAMPKMAILNFYEITIEIKDEISGINITGKSDSLGNIFFDNDLKEIKVNYDNLRTTEAALDVTYKIMPQFEQDKILYQYNKSINLADDIVIDTVSIPKAIKNYGTYVLSVTAKDVSQNLCATEEIPFSLCVYTPASEINQRFGINAHYNWGDRNPDKTMSLAKKAGFSTIREAYKWEDFEQIVDGERVFVPIDDCEEYISCADESGMNKFLLVGYGNPAILKTIPEEVAAAKAAGYEINSTYIPMTEKGRKAFVDYVLEVLKRHEGKFEGIELWNEPNLASGSSNCYQPTPGVEHYINLLKDVYIAVKSEFPDVLVGGPVISSIMVYESPWLEEFLAQNPHRYYDIFVFHNYSYTRRGGLDNILAQLEKYLSQIPEDKLIYMTEFGVMANVGDGLRTELSEKNEIYDFQARSVAQYYLAMESKNYCDKYFIYELTDDRTLSDRWGLLNMHNAEYAYVAKPSFLTLAAANYLMAGSEGKGYEKVDNTLRKLTFENINKGTKTYVYFTSDNSKKNITVKEEGVKTHFFDMYGNPINIEAVNNQYSVSVSGEPVYAVVSYSVMDVEITKEDDVYIISGTANSATPNSYLTMQMFAKTGETVYVDMTEIDENRNFSFELIPLMESDLYTIHFGNQGFDSFFAMETESLKTSEIYIEAKTDGEKILTLEEFNNAQEVYITANINSAEYEGEFNLIIAFYKNNAVNSAKIIDKDDMQFENGEYKLVGIDKPQNIDEVRIFLLDSMSNIMPLCEQKVLN